MAVAFVTVGANTLGTAVTTLSPALPSSRSNNNVLIAAIAVFATGKTFAVGGGWTIFAGSTLNSTSISGCLAWRLVDGAEATPVFTWTGAADCNSVVAQFSGNQIATPLGTVRSASADSSTTATMPSVVTTAANSLIFGAIFTNNNQTIPLPLGWTNVAFTSTTESNLLFDGFVGTSGSGSQAVSVAVTSANWLSLGVEIIGPGGAASNVNLRDTQVIQQVLYTPSPTFLPSWINANTAVQGVAT